MNGNKENARVVKTYVCKCGEVNRFSFETDFNFTEIRIDANCQGCGKDISISVEKHLAGNGNASNANGGSYPFNQANGNYNSNYNGNYSSVPSSSLLESPTQYPQDSSSQAPSTNTIPDFNFDALTTAAESMNPAQDTPTTQATAAPDYSGAAEILGSLSSDIVDGVGDEEHVPEVAEPAPPPLAAKVFTTPVKKPVEDEVKEEDKDLLSREEEGYGEEANPDEQEAFIDLFGRL